MQSHPYGWLSLLPPLVAIALAIVTRKATVSLLAGVFFGALLTTGGNFFAAVHDTLEVHLWPTVTDAAKLRVFCFTLLMGALIGVVCRSGGMQGLIHLLSPFAKSRRGGQLVTWFLGLLIFFDDYANTILLGNTLRPLCDRLGISRQKLAYLVDSTAAPVAAISLLSTWVAVEIEYIREGLQTLGSAAELTAIDLFVGSIPYRFYILASLVLIPIIALTGRDFGAMLKAERRRLADSKKASPEMDATDPSYNDHASDMPPRWYNAVLPFIVTLGVVVWLMISTGKAALASGPVTSEPSLRVILGAANSGYSLMYGALAGLLLAMLLAKTQRLLSSPQLLEAAAQGAKIVLPALAILWCASSLSRMTGSRSVEGTAPTVAYEFKEHRLYTGDYLVKLLVPDDVPLSGQDSETVTTKLLPTIVFLVAAVLSFATGTSFGAMGILLPIVVPLAHALLSSPHDTALATHPIMLATVGSVLAGAVFGDHCSPISDTTILSSQACACDHMEHVLTQLPYALLAAGAAILLGTLPLGWGVSVWILLPLQVLALLAFVMVVGQTPETGNSISSEQS
jgi:Na+/H+ antiporter NhaC